MRRLFTFNRPSARSRRFVSHPMIWIKNLDGREIYSAGSSEWCSELFILSAQGCQLAQGCRLAQKSAQSRKIVGKKELPGGCMCV